MPVTPAEGTSDTWRQRLDDGQVQDLGTRRTTTVRPIYAKINYLTHVREHPIPTYRYECGCEITPTLFDVAAIVLSRKYRCRSQTKVCHARS